jgi:peroxiredoxin
MSDVPGIAPLFALPSSKGTIHALTEMLEHGRVLLVFHRGTW